MSTPCAGPASSLTSVQQEIVQAGLLDAPASALLQLPTGSGKTFLARRAIHATLARGYAAVYLCPLRAIARELYADWQREFPGLGVYTGETGVDEAADIPSPANAQVLICTPEKFDAFLRQWQRNYDWLSRIDLLVVDELHLLGDDGRGATLEAVIARFRHLNPYLRVLGLSATLGNSDELAEWLGASLYRTDTRPVPLTWRIETFDAKGSGDRGKAALAQEEVRATRAAGGQVIVFCQSRPRTETLAHSLQEAGLRAEAHHAGLSPTRRLRAEAQFRAGELDAIIATPTLAMGVNLPARKVVLYDLQRFSGGGWEDLAVNEIWQLGGRAGRRGLDPSGEVVLISPRHNQKAARRYVEGRFEPIRSALTHSRKFDEQLLVLFGSRMCKTSAQAVRVLQGYLHGHQAPAFLAGAVSDAIARMCRAEMLEVEEGGTLRATRLGRLAVRHQLSAATVIAWRTFISDCRESGKEPSFLDVLTVVAGAADFNARIRADADELDLLAQALNAEPLLLSTLPITSWAPTYLAAGGRSLVFAVKTALALRAWTRLADLDEAAAAVSAQAHEVDEARKEMTRVLVGFRAVLELVLAPEAAEPLEVPRVRVLAEEADLTERVLALTAMVATGLDEQNASLALVEGIGPVFARRLVAAGIEDIEDLAQADPAELGQLEGLSASRAAKWVSMAEAVLSRGGAYRYREVRMSPGTFRATAGIDVYRWRRAASLEVFWLSPTLARVSGGIEPHQVRSAEGRWHCDCADAAKGNCCKHMLAVRHAAGDATVPKFDGPFFTADQDAMSLWAAWNDSRSARW